MRHLPLRFSTKHQLLGSSLRPIGRKCSVLLHGSSFCRDFPVAHGAAVHPSLCCLELLLSRAVDSAGSPLASVRYEGTQNINTNQHPSSCKKIRCNILSPFFLRKRTTIMELSSCPTQHTLQGQKQQGNVNTNCQQSCNRKISTT